MNIPDDIDGLDQVAYQQGRHPIDWATQKTRDYIDAHLEIAAARLVNPALYPGYCIPLTTQALARRIVGGLMDAGWTPPALNSPKDLQP